VETWTFDKPDDPADTVRRPVARLGQPAGLRPQARLAANVVRSRAIEGGRPLIAGAKGVLTVPEEVARGTYGVDYAAASPDCEGVAFGDREPPPTPDCGSRAGTGSLDLTFTDRRRLEVGWSRRRSSPASSSAPSGSAEASPRGAGGISPRYYRFSEDRLFDPRRKRLVLKGGTAKCFDETGFVICGEWQGPLRGRVVTTFNLTLRRR
jgi:hypothetical protein